MTDPLAPDPLDIFPITHSNLCSRSLSSLLATEYDIGIPTWCTILTHKVNDTYLVWVGEERYILRVFGARSTSLPDVLYEVDLLLHLSGKGISVSTPVARRDGGFVRAVNAPEGRRYLVLYTWATGENPSLHEAEAWLLGAKIAEMHEAARDFASRHARLPYDLGHLIDKPLAAIRSSIRHTGDDWKYLQQIAERLRAAVTTLLTEGLDWGACHGDVNGWNCNFDDGKVTFFGFEWCGPGWRAFDLAQFRLWHAAAWPAFLNGYSSMRSFDEAEQAAVPLFVALRQIWLTGRNTGWGNDWGFGGTHETRLTRVIDELKKWERGGATGV